MGAYRGGPTTFAVVGLASKPIHVFRLPWYKCEWISNNGSSIRAKAYKMLPDWGYGRVYTVVVVNCTFPVNPNQDNAGGRLMLNAYYGKSQRKYEKFTALEELPGSYNESKFHPPYHSHFVFHDAGGVSPEVRAALDLGYSANWTFYFDVDEYIYLPEGNTLESVLKDFSNYTQFTIEQNPMSSALCFNDSTQDYPRQWGFEKLLFRESRTGIRRDRKYAIQAKNAYATGVHMSENVIGKTLHQTETKIRYYHYHNSIQVQGELCREFLPLSAKNNVTWYNGLPYVYDDNMKKLAGTIKDFERNTIGNVQVYS
ncbi:galactan beta-1,4-galactosyltransferase GALS1 [Populus alba x Populus x berolinensis]|nr:galactan beta-1,4-galactosyltransferase GALS1 [Populus alba x Populus x berolinensis]